MTALAPAAKACLALAAAALSIAPASTAIGPEPALATAGQTQRAKCLKAARKRAAGQARGRGKKRVAKRACRREVQRFFIAPETTEPPSRELEPATAAGPTKPDGPTAYPQFQQGPEPPSDPEPPSSPTPPSQPAFRFFSPTSFWNAAPATDAELDPNSAALAAAFETTIAHERRGGNGPWINTTDYGVPIYTVPAEQPTVPVRLASPFFAPALQLAWNQVPLPSDARASAGSDRTLIVWQPSSDRIWEFWRFGKVDDEWQAAWGGAMQSVSSSKGYYDPEAWPGAKSWWGSSASSMSIAGGLVTLEDLQSGEIDHALALAVSEVRAGYYSSPAQRSDGTSSSPLALPEGAHLRIDPNLDLATLHLPGLTLMLAEAAQRYGIFVRDRAKVTHFFAQDPSPTGANPYAGPSGYFEGRSPAQLLAAFPWDHLQVLKMELHRQG